MKKHLYFLCFLLPFQVLAQTSSVEGIITDKITNEPLEFTSVSIYKSSDSTLVNGSITDKTGKFLIKEF